MDLMGFGATSQAIASTVNAGINAYAANRAQNKQIAWEKERAKHAHQWEVEDLKAAGLNPILSAGGQGATTGGISAPVPDLSGIGNAISSAFQLYNDSKRVENETEQTNADVNLKGEQSLKTAAETITEAYKQGLLTEQQANTAMDTFVKQKQSEQIENNINLSRKQYDLAEREYQLEKKRIQTEIYKAQKEGRLKEAQALEQELRNKDYKFYKYRDTIFGAWDRLNNTVDTFRNKKPQPKQERTERKETWIKRNGQWVNSALIIGSKFI